MSGPAPVALPFSVGWVSSRLYRVVADHGPYGRDVVLDGWDDALAAAWARILDDGPEVRPWVAAYEAARGDESLVVTVGDGRRVVARGGAGHFGVTYPADLLLADEAPEQAVRAMALVALDRHVDRRALGVPLLSSLTSRP